MAEVLPPTVAALSSIEELKLNSAGLQEFCSTVARSLTRLRRLVLVDNNFTRVPAALSHITTLEKIMLGNDKMQLEPSDVNTFAALPHLNSVYLFCSKEGWSPSSEIVYATLQERFPRFSM